jgi:hypothetical protein
VRDGFNRAQTLQRFLGYLGTELGPWLSRLGETITKLPSFHTDDLFHYVNTWLTTFITSESSIGESSTKMPFHCQHMMMDFNEVVTEFPIGRSKCPAVGFGGSLPPKYQIYAVHIHVGESQALLARTLYNGVYGSRKLGGFPQGIAMKFVPAIDDRRYPVTPAMRIKMIKMMSKQKVFTESLEAIHTTTIVGLHLYIP